MASKALANNSLPTATRLVGGLNHEREPYQKQREAQMEIFAENYAQTGAVMASADKAGIAPRTYYLWMQEDIRFQEMMKVAHQRHLEKWEGRAERIAQKNEDSKNPNPIMTIFTLKALAPLKYGDRIQVEDSRLDRLLEMTQRQRELADRERAEWIEGEAKVLPAGDQEEDDEGHL